MKSPVLVFLKNLFEWEDDSLNARTYGVLVSRADVQTKAALTVD